MQSPDQILHTFRRNPDTLGATFHNPLTMQEELLLHQLGEDLGRKVHEILDLALAAGPEILLSQEDRDRVMELSYFQKSVVRLLRKQGSLGNGRIGMN